MAGSAELVIKLLADTSSAEASFSKLEGSLGKALGIGAFGAVTAVTTKASMDIQDSMAKIAMAYNSADFAPGTAKYQAAQDQVAKFSTTLATSFDDVATVMAQASKITGSDGFKLTADKINEVTEASIRMQKASGGNMDAVTALQDQAILSKLFDNQDFAKTGALMAALSQQHPQDESTLLDTTIALGQYASPLGVTEAQTAALANYLSDTGLGGAVGGASVGRTMQRMNTAADQVLDPEQQYSDLKKHRDASEKADDLQRQLAVAEQRRSQMYGQHGLKTQYKRDPAAVMAADNEIAKLQREIADTQQDNAHLDDAKNKASRGAVDILSMANTAGMSADAFAQETKDDPFQAILDFTRGVHNLPMDKREAALTKAGITNTRDLKTIKGLTDQPDSIARMFEIATNADANPTALNQISDISLGTTSSKLEELHNVTRYASGLAGDPARQAVDAATSKALDAVNESGFGGLEQKIKDIEKAGEDAGKAVESFGDALKKIPGVQGAEDMISSNPVLQLAAALVGGKVAATAGGGVLSLLGGAVGGAGTAGAEAAAGIGVGGLATGGVIGAVLAGLFVGGKLLADHGAFGPEGERPSAGTAFSDHSGPLFQINVGQVGHDADQAFESIKSQFVAAWNAAMSGQPVSGQVGGNYATGQAPH